VLQIFAPLFWRPRKALYFARRAVAAPDEIRVPTRHGAVRALVYRPPVDAHAGNALPPVHVQIHGGGFYGRLPEQDEHIAAFIASDVGAVVVSIDYDVTPQVRYPVAEEQCYDVAAWVVASASGNGWDARRVSVGGESAGGKLAINVCQLAHASGVFRPCALVAAFAIADMTRADRTSAKPNAAIAPWLQRLVNATYFADASRRAEPLASPLYDADLAAALPATLIMTGADDTLAPEMDAIAERLRAAGVSVVHRRFAATDHGFTHTGSVATAREAIGLIGDHLRAAFSQRPLA
jgi:acetyl esterase